MDGWAFPSYVLIQNRKCCFTTLPNTSMSPCHYKYFITSSVYTHTPTPCLILVTSKMSAWFSLGQFFSHFLFLFLLPTYRLWDSPHPTPKIASVSKISLSWVKWSESTNCNLVLSKGRSNYPAGTEEYKHFHSGPCLSVFCKYITLESYLLS